MKRHLKANFNTYGEIRDGSTNLKGEEKKNRLPTTTGGSQGRQLGQDLSSGGLGAEIEKKIGNVNAGEGALGLVILLRENSF